MLAYRFTGRTLRRLVPHLTTTQTQFIGLQRRAFHMGTMPATASEAWEYINDRKKLIEYTQVTSAESFGIAPEKLGIFEMNLPYDDIHAFVLDMGKTILDKIPEDVASGLVWEHVGSTSIPGMPGAWHPDAACFTKERNPPKELVTALIDTGFKFIGIGRLHKYDLWFVKPITEGFLKGFIMKVHVNQWDSDPCKCLRESRDRCTNDKEAFESYKNSKVEAAAMFKAGNAKGYKVAKGKCAILLEIQAKHNIVMPIDLANLD